MRRWEFICFLVFGLVCPFVALAQQSAKQTKIGWPSPFSSSPTPAVAKNLQAFRQSLHLGHVEDRNIAIEFRNADGNLDRLPSLAAELVEQKVDIIVTVATLAAVAARKATSTIPIVAISITDPVGRGLVESLAGPGGNVTGLTLRTAVTIIESAPCGKLTRLGGIPGNLLRHYACRHDRQASDSTKVGSGRLKAR
jgi:putative ABC transport system substrate-binding protein